MSENKNTNRETKQDSSDLELIKKQLEILKQKSEQEKEKKKDKNK